ncbi:MAG: site-specific integrase [Bacteroidales bacterium]|nr:site-specific integrase [Bacteroidales bacterium]
MNRNYSLRDVVDYIPASLQEEKEWRIVYYAKDPQTGKLRRKRIRVGKIKSVKERRLWAKKMIYNINCKLHEGWNPFIESENSRQYHCIKEVLEAFLRDKRGLRDDTLRTYFNEVSFLQKFINKKYDENMYAVSFDQQMAVIYMETTWATREIGAVRYNNILAVCRVIFNWMVEKEYIKQNPFDKIKKKKTGSKTRVMDIDKADREKIRDYLQKQNRPYYAIMMFAFHSLLRPKEISYIKIGDIDLEKQVVVVRGSVAKNHNTRYAPIPDVMVDLVRELIEEVTPQRKNWYLFSAYGFRPGPVRRDSREIARYWSVLRKNLRLKKEIQFYSLRDSGIIQMIRDGRSPKEVMEAADHSSIEVTNKYVKVARKESNGNILKKSTAF